MANNLQIAEKSCINKTLNCDIAENFRDFKANGASVYISQGDSAKTDIEKESNEFISELLIMKTVPDNEYELPKEPVQLTLFETMEKYLDKKMLKADKSSDKPQPCHLS